MGINIMFSYFFNLPQKGDSVKLEKINKYIHKP